MHKLLLVEDHDATLFITKALLTSHGYEVETAVNGEEALEKARKRMPDIILSDVYMPVMDGYTLCKEVKKDAHLNPIPFIFYSATFVKDEDKQFGLDLGAEAYLLKTQEPEHFMEELNGVLEKCQTTHPDTVTTPTAVEEVYGKEYPQALMGKLEDKVSQLEKSNRSLTILCDFNTAIVHSLEESELLQSICRTIIETGGYQLVWIGIAGAEENTPPRPAVQVGFEAGYLENRQINWADTMLGEDPAECAIRTGEPCLLGGYLANSGAEAWHGEAAELGYNSMIALPLIGTHSDVFAVLNIYSNKADAFNAEEVGLLTRLANDLAYGIVAHKERVARKLAEEEVRKGEIKYSHLIDSLGADYFLYSHNPNGVFTDLSPSITDMLGYSQEEFQSHYTQYMTDSPKNKNVERFTELSLQGEVQPAYEIEITHKDGSARTLEVSEIPVFDKKGAVIAIEGIAHDITEREKIKETLEKLVTERTASLQVEIKERKKAEVDLQRTIEDLEHFTELVVGREEEMIRLKEEINSLLAEAGRKEKYKIAK